MPALEYSDIIKDLKTRSFAPIYFLQGEEPYFIDKVSDFIEEHALGEAEKSFNQTIVYGRDVNHQTLMDIVRRYPMMSEKQVVILKEAQNYDYLDKLDSYFDKPMPSTIFVICYKYKKFRKGTKAQKSVEKNGVFMNSEKLKDIQLPKFVDAKAQAIGLRLDPHAANLLVEYLGNDLSKIENQLDKLAINAQPGRPVNSADIEKYIGISKDYNVFELTDALVKKDQGKAQKIATYFGNNPKEHHPIMVIAFLYSFYSKAYAYFHYKNQNDSELMKSLGTYWGAVQNLRTYGKYYKQKKKKKSVALMHEYDLKSKGVDFTGNEGDLLRELVFKLMN